MLPSCFSFPHTYCWSTSTCLAQYVPILLVYLHLSFPVCSHIVVLPPPVLPSMFPYCWSTSTCLSQYAPILFCPHLSCPVCSHIRLISLLHFFFFILINCICLFLMIFRSDLVTPAALSISVFNFFSVHHMLSFVHPCPSDQNTHRRLENYLIVSAPCTPQGGIFGTCLSNICVFIVHIIT